MRTVLLFIALFSLTNSYGQTPSKPTRSIKIFNCETGLIYSYADNKIEFKGTWFVPDSSTDIWYSKTVDNFTSAAFSKLFDTFATLDKKVIYYNHCVDDGFHFKVYIQVDTSLQKIFVGNYYDKVIDSLTSLFDEQLKEFKASFSFNIGYGKNKDEIERLIKWQTECKQTYSEDYKNHLLDNWCEINSAR